MEIGIGRFQVVTANDGTHHLVKTTIPYWSIVIPLTLLSAYLPLSKPRQAKERSLPAPQ